MPMNPDVSPLNSIQAVKMFDGEVVEPKKWGHLDGVIIGREGSLEDSLKDIKPLAPEMIEEEKRETEEQYG